jgi:flagellar assembly protein FliH
LIKAGEPFTFSAFNFQNPASPDWTARPASAPPAVTPPPVNLPHLPVQRVVQDERMEAVGNAMDEVLPNTHELLQTARAEAQRIVADAQARAAEIERAARERGRAEAHALAQAELNQAAEDLRARLSDSLSELAGLRAQMVARTEQDMVRLALEIAKKIVRREVKVDHEVALTLARVALTRINSRASATIRLHPDDYDYVREHRERLDTDSALEIVEDRSIGVGGCIVQSELGEIDARIEQQFAEIEKDFLSA